MSDKRIVAILGAGISGLTVAHRLKTLGVSFILFESESTVGGKIQTEKIGANLVEQGPNSLMLKDGKSKELLRELGIESRVCFPSQKRPARYICDGRALHKMSPFTLVNFIGPTAMLRILSGGFSRRADSLESVHEFFKRKLGERVAEKLVAPFVSGIYAGDSHRLIAKTSFPKLFKWDEEFNSFWGALLHRKAEKKDHSELPSGICSFPTGLRELPEALYQGVREHVRLEEKVLSLKRTQKGWSIRTNHGEIEVSQVVSSLPAPVLATLLDRSDYGELCEKLQGLRYPWIRVLHLAYPKENLASIPRGFGFLNIPGKSLPFLGCLFSSQLFEDRSLQSTPYFTLFIGGETQAHLSTLQVEDSVESIHESLQQVLRFQSPPPKVISSKDWSQGIPQYDEHHFRFQEYLLENNPENHGLYLSSNFIGGISIPECIESAYSTADKVCSALKKSTV